MLNIESYGRFLFSQQRTPTVRQSNKSKEINSKFAGLRERRRDGTQRLLRLAQWRLAIKQRCDKS